MPSAVGTVLWYPARRVAPLRSNGWWAVSVPAIPGLFTQARRLNQVDGLVREAAALLGCEVADVRVVPELDEDARLMLEELDRVRVEAEEAQRRSSELTRRAVERFRGEGFTLRDIASLVGLSQQRVSVLLKRAS